ncbi:MAG: hypothetical protein MJ213_04270 [Bacilli bacterium]|nr:hypothetical protein [Bacilli bacterium]
MKHNIIVKFFDNYDYQNELNNIKELFNKALSVPGILDIKFHPAIKRTSNRHDLWIELIVNELGLENWKECAVHIQWKNQYTKYIANKVIFDCLD